MSRPTHLSWRPWLLTALLVPGAMAQITFSDRTITEDRRDSHAAAYDPAQGRVVQFGGLLDGTHLDSTVAFDGQTWIRFAGSGPSERQNAVLCQDPIRGSLLLFGGRASDGSLLGDTWRYQDGAWSQLAVPGPSARWLAAMVFDSGRDTAVLHGGNTARGATAETLEYSAQGWRRVSASGPLRANHAMAYDSLRRVTVLFGGYDRGSQADHWEYSGSQGWVLRPVVGGPPARHNHAMCFDAARGRVVLFGGKDDVGRIYDDIWEFDGKAWTRHKPATIPPARELCTLTYDEGRRVCVLTGGNGGPNGSGTLGDAWEWDGEDWRPRQVTPPTPAWLPARAYHAAAYDIDRNQTVVHGGMLASGQWTGDTWIYDGSNWLPRPGANGPVRRVHTMAHMSRQGKTVMFGGVDASGAVTNDTFEWDGQAWTRVFPANAPPARSGHAMAYDPVRDRIVMCCGTNPSQIFTDTWEYDGSNWMQRPTAHWPLAGISITMAYDAHRQRMVLFGGFFANFTYEYDGSDWREIPIDPANRPPNYPSAMAYDSGRGVFVLATYYGIWEYDGVNPVWVKRASLPHERNTAVVYDVLRRTSLVICAVPHASAPVDLVLGWNGTTLQPRARFAQPAPRSEHAVAYEPVSGRALLFGGQDGEGALQDTWSFDGALWQLEQPAHVPPQRSGCALATTSPGDPRFGTVWLVGGSDSLGQLHEDSYVWDPSLRDWKVVSTNDPWVVRRHHAMSQHPGSNYPVLFGGEDPSGMPSNDTIRFDGTRWVPVWTPDVPAARELHGMAYDEARDVVVLFGGRGVGQTQLDDTWEFDGSNWKQVQLPLHPTARWGHALVYDAQRARVVLSGGRTGTAALLPDVWEYDGRQWRQRLPNTTRPAARSHAAAAFDVRRARMVLHGGADATTRFADTWEYFAPTDVGTLGTWTGAQQLTVLDAPLLGSTFRVQYEATAGFGVLLMHAGPSNVPLQQVAPPQFCEISAAHLDLKQSTQIPGTGNPCVSSVTMPNDPGLLGTAFSLQGLGSNTSCLKLSLPMVFTMRAR